ncbi:MAG: ATP-binding protein [Candidatus Eremiobacteraeota bacterium]|nr:ATP-binding protein [Candidatus Eremiobacteraeota bacterium]
MKRFKRRYPSTPRSVSDARHDLTGFASDCGVVGEDAADVALAVGEACNNAVEHGHVAGADFLLAGECGDGVLRVEIADAGRGFTLAGKGESMSPELRGVRGLGIFLMRALMDDVGYEIGEEGTRVHLVKRIRGSARSGDGAKTPAEIASFHSGGCS